MWLFEPLRDLGEGEAAQEAKINEDAEMVGKMVEDMLKLYNDRKPKKEDDTMPQKENGMA
jgi:hypothetical protein